MLAVRLLLPLTDPVLTPYCLRTDPVQHPTVPLPHPVQVRVASRMGGAISFNQIEKALRGSRERRTLADGHDPLALHLAQPLS